MAKFDLNQYDTVDSRIKKFLVDYEDGRIVTEIIAMDGEIGKTRWVVKASAFRYLDEVVPSATGFAFEVDGTGMANQTSALENAETSARGRCLQALGYTGAKSPSREEMEKVQRAEKSESTAQVDWLAEAAKCKTKDELRFLWSKARSVNADAEVLMKIQEMADAVSNA
jgi:hypothetical protein